MVLWSIKWARVHSLVFSSHNRIVLYEFRFSFQNFIYQNFNTFSTLFMQEFVDSLKLSMSYLADNWFFLVFSHLFTFTSWSEVWL